MTGKLSYAALQKPRSRALNAFLWLGPIFFLLWLYWDGLQSWFIADDFAWLGLLRQYHTPADLLSILFAPAAQGTIRPWSERGFFLLFESLFGLDNLPFRIAAFATMACNLLLVAWIMRRITQSALAGFVAAIVWSANTALVTAMAWSAAFNQVLCPLFLLAALALFIRFAESGRRVFWWCQLAVFVLGFGVLEINVIYPALAVAWTLFCATPQPAPAPTRRKLLLSLVPAVALSVAYFLIHRAVAPLPVTGAYVLHFDLRIFRTLALYGKWSLLPVDWQAFGHSALNGKLILFSSILALTVLFVTEAKNPETQKNAQPRRFVILFFIAWYLAALAPILPLPDHHTDYYLTIPLIGLAMLAAWAVHSAFLARSVAWRIVATVTVVVYLAGMVPMSRSVSHWWLQRTLAVRGLVLGTQAAQESHPGQVILLDGVTSALYTDSVGQGALYAAGIDAVYLTPGSELKIEPGPDLADLDRTILTPAATLHAIRKDQVVVYSIAGDHLRNITETYERSAPNRFQALNHFDDPLPDRIDVGNPLYSWLLGPGWLAPESGVRWMSSKASLRLKGPQVGNKLHLEGYFPEEQLKQGLRHLVVTAVGIGRRGPGRLSGNDVQRSESVVLGETKIIDPESTFQRLLAIPDSLAGWDSVEIEIRVDPVTRKDNREYGVVFGKLAFTQ